MHERQRGGAGGYPLTVAYGDVRAGKDFGNASFGSGSTMTNSAFQLVDDLAPWTITDFEILLNAQNTIVATNPGQFYYHQRATNTSGGTASMGYTINWPCQFQTQTSGGQPIHAYVQYASDSANVWRDWTPQSTGISWTNQPSRLATRSVRGPARAGHDHGQQRPGRREGLGHRPSRLRAQGHDRARTTTSVTHRSRTGPSSRRSRSATAARATRAPHCSVAARR